MANSKPSKWEMIGWYSAWAFVVFGLCFAVYATVKVLTRVGG